MRISAITSLHVVLSPLWKSWLTIIQVDDRFELEALSFICLSIENSDGLCCLLTFVCPRPKPTTSTISKDVWEVPRNSLQFVKKLGQGMFGTHGSSSFFSFRFAFQVKCGLGDGTTRSMWRSKRWKPVRCPPKHSSKKRTSWRNFAMINSFSSTPFVPSPKINRSTSSQSWCATEVSWIIFVTEVDENYHCKH